MVQQPAPSTVIGGSSSPGEPVVGKGGPRPTTAARTIAPRTATARTAAPRTAAPKTAAPDPAASTTAIPRAAASDVFGKGAPLPATANPAPAAPLDSGFAAARSLPITKSGPPAAAGELPSAAALSMPATANADTPPRASSVVAESEDYSVVKVYYGTDRRPVNVAQLTWQSFVPRFVPAMIAGAVTLLLFAAVYFRRERRRLLITLAASGLVITLVFGGAALVATNNMRQAAAKSDRIYGAERGSRLEVGTCEVSVPRDHRVGEIESPSLLRLEFAEDDRRHVVLRRITALDDAAFYEDLRGCVQQCNSADLFVFVHGFNVNFDDAVRRTAQIAYDLKFQGAPVCYSWPSQGSVLGYTVDENNVEWTVAHLKEFLTNIVERTGARTVNLVAHSMGSRALTSALRQFAEQSPGGGPRFNKVVLAAPDIDAEIFERDIAPKIVQTADHVTLYASSSDLALVASKQVHNYPRAGESGERMIVIPGIDTIDVSSVDTSFLGHSYYGSSDSILADLYELIHGATSANDRSWLQPMLRNGLTYWVFQQQLVRRTDDAGGSSSR